jgi:predicted outer membrane protein
MNSTILALAFALTTTAASAQTPDASSGGAPPPTPAARGPSLELAIEAARVAIDTCTAKGHKVGVFDKIYVPHQ